MNRIKIFTAFLISIPLIAMSDLNAHSLPANADNHVEDVAVIYLDNRMEPVNAMSDAVYYAEMVEKKAKSYHFQVFFLTGELKMDGWYADNAMTLPQGHFTFYYRSGQIESEGEYRDGYKYGIWKRYTRDGQPKSERIYAFTPMMKAIGAIE